MGKALDSLSSETQVVAISIFEYMDQINCSNDSKNNHGDDIDNVVVIKINTQLNNMLESHYNRLLAALDKKEQEIAQRQIKSEEYMKHMVTLLSDNVIKQILAVRTFQENAEFGVFDMPLLPVFSEPGSKGFTGTLQRAVFSVYRVHFLCPVCGLSAESGNNKSGYKLLVPGEWTLRMVAAMKFALMALQILSLITPVPLPHLTDLTQYLPAELRKDADLVDLFDHVKSQMQSSFDKWESNKVTNQNINAAQVTTHHMKAVDQVSVDRDHINLVKSLFILFNDENISHSGLRRAYRSSDGSCCWVCENPDRSCYDKFMTQGPSCLSISLKFT
jgi:hypothetical protein